MPYCPKCGRPLPENGVCICQDLTMRNPANFQSPFDSPIPQEPADFQSTPIPQEPIPQEPADFQSTPIPQEPISQEPADFQSTPIPQEPADFVDFPFPQEPVYEERSASSGRRAWKAIRFCITLFFVIGFPFFCLGYAFYIFLFPSLLDYNKKAAQMNSAVDATQYKETTQINRTVDAKKYKDFYGNELARLEEKSYYLPDMLYLISSDPDKSIHSPLAPRTFADLSERCEVYVGVETEYFLVIYKNEVLYAACQREGGPAVSTWLYGTSGGEKTPVTVDNTSGEPDWELDDFYEYTVDNYFTE